jgi:hypothetical protein
MGAPAMTTPSPADLAQAEALLVKHLPLDWNREWLAVMSKAIATRLAAARAEERGKAVAECRRVLERLTNNGERKAVKSCITLIDVPEPRDSHGRY